MVYLLYKGIQDTFLTENPDFTCFKTVITRDTESVTRGYDIPFDNPSAETLICTLPRNGDYIERMTLKIIVPQLTNTLDQYWSFDASNLSGNMYGFDNNGYTVFVLKLVGNLATSNVKSGWYKSTGDVLVSETSPSLFQFGSYSNTVASVVFDSINLANFWGFLYNPIYLYGGPVQFSIPTTYKSNISPYYYQNDFTLPSGSYVSGWPYFSNTNKSFFLIGSSSPGGGYSISFYATTMVNFPNATTLSIGPYRGSTYTMNGEITGCDGAFSIYISRMTVNHYPYDLYNCTLIFFSTDWSSHYILNEPISFSNGNTLQVDSVFTSSQTTLSFTSNTFVFKSPDIVTPSGLIVYTDTIQPYTCNTFNSQASWSQTGWYKGIPQTQSSATSYANNIIENSIQSITLQIGGQLVQEFDPFYIRYTKESTQTYKNRPVLDLVQNGDTSVVDFNRVFYYEIPCIQIPIHALTRQDVRLLVKTIPSVFSVFTPSLIVHYDVFQVDLPTEYSIPITQVAYFSNKIIDSKGDMVKFITSNINQEFIFSLNGEQFCDSEYTTISSYENDFNIPISSNTCIINGTMCMNRFRYQLSSPNVYTETKNTLFISRGISGLQHNITETSQWKEPVFTYLVSIMYPLLSLTAFDTLGNLIQFMAESNSLFGSFLYLNSYYSYDSSNSQFNINSQNYAFSCVFKFIKQTFIFEQGVPWNFGYPNLPNTSLWSYTGTDTNGMQYVFSLNSTSSNVNFVSLGGSAIMSPTVTNTTQDDNGYITSITTEDGRTITFDTNTWISYYNLPVPSKYTNQAVYTSYIYYDQFGHGLICWFRSDSGTLTGVYGVGGNTPSYTYSYVNGTVYISGHDPIPNGISFPSDGIVNFIDDTGFMYNGAIQNSGGGQTSPVPILVQ